MVAIVPDEDTWAGFDVVSSSTGPFNFGFQYMEKADLEVTVDDVALALSAWNLTTGSAVEAGGYDGGSFTLNTAVANKRVVIARKSKVERDANLSASQLNFANINSLLNRYAYSLQEFKRDIARALLATYGTTPVVVDPDDIEAIAAIVDEIATVAGIDAEVLIAAGLASEIALLASNINDINTLADWLTGTSSAGVLQVADYAAMKALTADQLLAYSVIIVRGARGGMFEIKTASSGTVTALLAADPGEGIYVALTNGGGTTYVQRIFDGVVDAAFYGFSTSATAAANTTALNYCLNYLRSVFAGGNITSAGEPPCAMKTGPGQFNVNSINATQIRSRAWRWDAYGTQLTCAQDMAVVLDLTHSRGYSIRNLVIKGDETTPPLRGFQTGYMDGATSSGDFVLDNCQTYGKFEQAAFYNGGSEEVVTLKCRFRNTNTAADSFSGIVDGYNWWGKYSAYLTPANGDHMAAAVTTVSAAATATVTTAVAHGLTTGEFVRFFDVAGSTDVDGFDSYWEVLSTPTTTTFTIGGTNAAGGTGGYVWRVQANSFVDVQHIETAFFKDNGGPAVWKTSNCQRHKYRGYVYSPDDDGVVIYFRPTFFNLSPHGCVFDAAFEGSALKSMFRLTLGENTTQTFNIGNWKIADHGPQNTQAVFKTNASTSVFNFIGIDVDISTFAGSSRSLVDTQARYKMQGKIATRNATGITSVPQFDGDLIVNDPNNSAIPSGACRILSHNVGGADSQFAAMKGRHRFYGGDAEVTSNFSNEAFSQISGVGLTAPGINTIGFSLADDTATSFALPSANLGAGALIAVASASGSAANSLVYVRGSASPAILALTTLDANTVVTTGTLAGTTGTDTKFTISVANDGRVYLENRRGLTLSGSVTVVAAVI